MAGRPALQATAWAAGVAGALGSAVNDSGLLVAAAVAAVAWPALVVAATSPGPPEFGAEAVGVRAETAS
jgi:hypothetical protein